MLSALDDVGVGDMLPDIDPLGPVDALSDDEALSDVFLRLGPAIDNTGDVDTSGDANVLHMLDIDNSGDVGQSGDVNVGDVPDHTTDRVMCTLSVTRLMMLVLRRRSDRAVPPSNRCS